MWQRRDRLPKGGEDRGRVGPARQGGDCTALQWLQPVARGAQQRGDQRGEGAGAALEPVERRADRRLHRHVLPARQYPHEDLLGARVANLTGGECRSVSNLGRRVRERPNHRRERSRVAPLAEGVEGLHADRRVGVAREDAQPSAGTLAQRPRGCVEPVETEELRRQPPVLGEGDGEQVDQQGEHLGPRGLGERLKRGRAVPLREGSLPVPVAKPAQSGGGRVAHGPVRVGEQAHERLHRLAAQVRAVGLASDDLVGEPVATVDGGQAHSRLCVAQRGEEPPRLLKARQQRHGAHPVGHGGVVERVREHPDVAAAAEPLDGRAAHASRAVAQAAAVEHRDSLNRRRLGRAGDRLGLLPHATELLDRLHAHLHVAARHRRVAQADHVAEAAKRASRRAPHARRADHVGRAEQGAQEPRRHARVLRAAEGGQLQQVPREAGLASALRAQLDPRLVSLATRASDASARIPCRGRRRRRLASAAAGRFCSRPRGARGAQPALVRPIPRGVASFGSRSRSACLRQLRAVRRGRRVHKGRRLLRGCSRRLSSSRRRRRRRL